MTDRTTVNVTKDAHTDAGEVKDRHDETWSDVLEFYANHRGSISTSGLGQNEKPIQDIDTQAIAEQLSHHIGVSNFNGQISDERAEEMLDQLNTLEGRIDDLEAQLPAKVAGELR